MQRYDDMQTFLLPRPTWVSDLDVFQCASCNTPFSALKRRHHCRHCGNIFCHDCSSRNVPLPQLGYGSKPVRVCKGCFELAYLITYMIDDDHGVSTQIHGARGLLEFVEKDNEDDLHSLVAYGGIDALVWLCQSATDPQLCHLATTILALLAEKESVRPVIITKWAVPPLLHLIERYMHHDRQKQETKSEGSNELQQEIALEIIINCTHVFFQLARAGILSQTSIVDDGVLNTLLTLSAYDPALVVPEEREEDQEAVLEQLRERVVIIQSWSAKAVSAISGQVSHQPHVIELVRGTDRLAPLLRSPNYEVRKYIAKSIAYLSLRNDKYKSSLLGDDVARALVSVIALLPQQQDESMSAQVRRNDMSYYLSREVKEDQLADNQHDRYAAAVSHTCCALANFATNNESQTTLISQPHFLRYLCNVPAVFCSYTEIHRHVARCLANLALYADNHERMLSDDEGQGWFNVLPTLLAMGQSAHCNRDIQRHIIRAIDNLSTSVSDTETIRSWQLALREVIPYVERVLEDSPDDDDDTLKRTESILERTRLLPPVQQEEKQEEKTSKPKRNHRNKKKKNKQEESF